MEQRTQKAIDLKSEIYFSSDDIMLFARDLVSMENRIKTILLKNLVDELMKYTRVVTGEQISRDKIKYTINLKFVVEE